MENLLSVSKSVPHPCIPSFGTTEYTKGGYNLKAIAKSALAVTRTLMGEPPDRMQQTRPTAGGAATVRMVANYQSRFWPFLNPNGTEG